MSPYNKTNKVNDIERPINSTIQSRDILGINPNIDTLSKTSSEIQDEGFRLDFINKIK